MPEKHAVKTDKAPGAIGPYSQAVKSSGWVFTAGVIALDPASGEMIGGTIQDQAHRVLQSLKGILEAGGGSMDHVVKTTIYLTDLKDFAAVNEIYGQYFNRPFPARSTVQVAALPKGAAIEIEAVAYTGF
jgi:2-iminobutanoate/2-iminopropanoate deaminase